jgi:hypothetical protein
VAAIKQGDTTTNQNSVSAMGGHGGGRQLRRNIWGEAFCNRLAAANEAMKNIKIKIHHDLKQLQNVVKNATINKKRAALMEERWDEMIAQ